MSGETFFLMCFRVNLLLVRSLCCTWRCWDRAKKERFSPYPSDPCITVQQSHSPFLHILLGNQSLPLSNTANLIADITDLVQPCLFACLFSLWPAESTVSISWRWIVQMYRRQCVQSTWAGISMSCLLYDYFPSNRKRGSWGTSCCMLSIQKHMCTEHTGAHKRIQNKGSVLGHTHHSYAISIIMSTL